MSETVSLREHFEALRIADQRAVEAAFEAAKEKAERHNELIGAMERQSAAFVTKGQVYAVVIATVAVATLVSTILGRVT